MYLTQTVNHIQKIFTTKSMQNAFFVLQMPLFELSKWLEKEIEKNPLLEITLNTPPSEPFQIPYRESLYQYLERQVSLHYSHRSEKNVALYIAGNLNEKGFLTLSEKEICQALKINSDFYRRLIKIFHHIEPIGLGAKDVRHSLLIQLSILGKKKSLLYQIISNDFEAILNNHYLYIAKKFKVSLNTIKQLIQTELRSLNPFPAQAFGQANTQIIIPDMIIDQEEDHWKIEVNDAHLPSFHFHLNYLNYLSKPMALTKQEYQFIVSHVSKGKWLQQIIERRKKILFSIGSYLLKKQQMFIEGVEDYPLPMTQREIAKSLHLSESTITRALHQKYVFCPRGIVSLDQFFSSALQSKSGRISSKKVKALLQMLIEKENKNAPFSDLELSHTLSKQGIACARRTVTKYRQELNIPSCYKRKF